MSSSNKHEPIKWPKGSISVYRENDRPGLWSSQSTFTCLLVAADKLFTDLEHLNRLPHSEEREIKAEHVTTAISAMYATVELLGIEPLVHYLAGRMEQADLDIGSYEIERKIRP